MHETSGRAKEEEFLSQDGQMCDRCRMCRTERRTHNLQSALTEYLIQIK